MVRGAQNVMWRCQCDCGGSVVAAGSNIKSGGTKSCGCLARETAADLLRGNTTQRSHLRSHTPEYNSWSGAKQRCTNPAAPKYPSYGARGIKMCDRWANSFEAFFTDMGIKPSPKHTLHRVNNDGHYEPSNCEWATPVVQGRNTTRSVYVEIDGERLCLSAWCEKLNIPYWKLGDLTRSRCGYPPRFKSKDDVIYHFYLEAKS